MTQINEKDHEAQMADMKAFDEQMPCVGIFWYDPKDHTLFGVRKKELTPREVEEAAEKGKPFINYPQLHRTVWAKEFFRAQAKHLETKFKGDYTQIPRGRIAWTIDKFIVLVGKWAEPIQEELTALLEEEFSLPFFEFVYDEHWDLGHGWSGDMPTTRQTPFFVFERIHEIMVENGITDYRCIGPYCLTYKENADDFREPPTLQMLIIQERHLARPLKTFNPLYNKELVKNQMPGFDLFLDEVDMVVFMVKHDHNKLNWIS